MRPSAASRSAIICDSAGGTTTSASPCRMSSGAVICPTTESGERRAVAIDRLGQRPDDRIEIVLLEPVRRLVELEQIGDAEEIDARGAKIGVLREHVEHREPPCGPTHDHHALRVGPAALARGTQPRRDIRGVEIAPPPAHRLQVGPAVAAAAAVVGHEDGPPRSIQNAHRALNATWLCELGPPWTEQSSGGGSAPVADVVGRYRRPWTVPPSSPDHSTSSGSTRPADSKPPTAPPRATRTRCHFAS